MRYNAFFSLFGVNNVVPQFFCWAHSRGGEWKEKINQFHAKKCFKQSLKKRELKFKYFLYNY